MAKKPNPTRVIKTVDPEIERNPFVRESLNHFLRTRSKEVPGSKCCPDCGFLLSAVETRFRLDGDDQSWNIPLQFCLRCHPELADRGAAAASD